MVCIGGYCPLLCAFLTAVSCLPAILPSSPAPTPASAATARSGPRWSVLGLIEVNEEGVKVERVGEYEIPDFVAADTCAVEESGKHKRE